MKENVINIQNNDLIRMQKEYPLSFHHSLIDKIKIILFWVIFLGFILFCLRRTGFFEFEKIKTGILKLGWLLKFMIPPKHNGWFFDFIKGIFETISMAFLGTLIASIFAIPIGLLGAKNIIPSFAIHFSIRRSIDCIRAIDQLIWALIFINVVGLGPFAGILAIAVSDTGVLSKLYAEAIENVDKKQIEGVKASGSNFFQVIRYAIIPQVLPVMLSNSLYYFESNTRTATILGVVGAGGIGLMLSDRIRVNNWDEVSFIIILILITVSSIDFLSKKIRHKFIKA
jgi:phosphonate transport system permease protein